MQLPIMCVILLQYQTVWVTFKQNKTTTQYQINTSATTCQSTWREYWGTDKWNVSIKKACKKNFERGNLKKEMQAAIKLMLLDEAMNKKLSLGDEKLRSAILATGKWTANKGNFSPLCAHK